MTVLRPNGVKPTVSQMSIVASASGVEPRFDESYLNDAFATLNTGTPRESREIVRGSLTDHAASIAKTRLADECENAVADLNSGVIDTLTGIFDKVVGSFLPAPLWQRPATPKKKHIKQIETNLMLRCLKIVSAARLALANDNQGADKALMRKIDRIFRAATEYLNSVPNYDSLDDLESLILLAELEYGRNQLQAAEMRLQTVVVSLTESSRMRSTLIFGQGSTLLRRRKALQTALLMLHWYYGQVPGPLENLSADMDLDVGESVEDAEEMFIAGQLRLASLQHRLQKYLDSQPVVDERAWSNCEKAFNSWHDDLKDVSKSLDNLTEDAPVNFFVFYQQYLSTRINLSRSYDRLYNRRSGITTPNANRNEMWTCPSSARTDAVKIASSLRSYGQKHRFREAPLCFISHISTAADIIVNVIEAATSEDDRNAYLHICSFLCGVLKYLAEVHVRAATLLDALQQRMNTVMLNPHILSKSAAADWDANSSLYSVERGHDTQLWQWTRHELPDDFGYAAATPEPERPRSVAGVLQTATRAQALSERPAVVRRLSTPASVTLPSETGAEDATPTVANFLGVPSYYAATVGETASMIGRAA